MDAPDWQDPRSFLSRHGLRPKDSFGQCFLIAPPVAQKIVDAVDPRPEETLVEVGTGCGTLARMLAPRARRVLALERDRELVAALRTEPLAPNIELLETDAGAYDYAAQCAREPTSLVGNLPYQITGKLLRAMLVPPLRWRVAVVMIQREVAERLRASPGGEHWGVLGVFTSAACEVSLVCDASPRCFFPAPRVHSTVLKLVPRAKPLAEETPAFRLVVHALFAMRRKTLLNGLSSLPETDRARAARACEASGIDSRLRPEVLTLAQLDALTRAWVEARA